MSEDLIRENSLLKKALRILQLRYEGQAAGIVDGVDSIVEIANQHRIAFEEEIAQLRAEVKRLRAIIEQGRGEL
jgi:hypothetical protein